MSEIEHPVAITALDARSSRPDQPDAALELIVVTETTVGRHLLPPGTHVVGRGNDANIRIDSPAVSRRHARIIVADALHIEDCHSRNGTFVHGSLVTPGTLVAFNLKDVIDLGTGVALLFQRRTRSGNDLVCSSELCPHVDTLLERIAKSPISVVLEGETGVGKELYARRLHAASTRAAGPWVVINCAAVSESLLESELFGYERGAFTGAARAKVGLIETANGGTVLLDEVGEMPAVLQAKLLRVIEQREVLPVGAVRPRPVDIRVISATHRRLAEEVAAERFRQDLWFRLNGITLHIEPLRARRAEIEPLARLFIHEMAAEMQLAEEPKIGRIAMSIMNDHPWPGNVRELRNVVRRAVVVAGGQEITEEHILFGAPQAMRASTHDSQSAASTLSLQNEVEVLEKKRVIEALDACHGNQSRAAHLLGIARGTLIARIERHGLARPRKG